jgi:hypothetical protein
MQRDRKGALVLAVLALVHGTGMQRDRKAALALVVPDLVRGVGYRRVVPRGMREDRKAALALEVRPHPERRGNTHPNVGKDTALRRLDELRVQIVNMDACKGSGNKVQDARALMEAEALEGKGNFHAEAGLGLAIGPFELAFGAYSSI